MKTRDKRTAVVVVAYLGLALAALNCNSIFSSLTEAGSSVSGVTSSKSVDVAQQIMEDTNRERRQLGLAPLVWDDHLASAATSHSDEMIQLNYFEHGSPKKGYENAMERVERTGAQPNAVGECIFEAEGYPARQLPDTCVKSWVGSPSHHAIMMDSRYRAGGVGVSKQGELYRVTMVFATFD